MTLSRKEITAAREVYEKYWDSYFIWNMKKFGSLIDPEFSMIGTSESEVSFGRADTLEILKAQQDEVAEKAEKRNRQVREIPVGEMLQIIEFCDIYVLIDSEWTFYSKFRLSTLMNQTTEGWKVLQQHGSVPDMRVGEGETIAVDKIRKENIELRDAVKRRTIELENKSRELEIEAALERVRAQTMAMHSSQDLEETTKILFDELGKLNMKVERSGIGIFNAETLDCQLYTTVVNDHGEKELTSGITSLTVHPMLIATVDAWKSYKPLSYKLEGKELDDYYKIIRKGKFPLSRKLIEKSANLPKEFYHYTPFSAGGLYFFSDSEHRNEDKEIMSRFAEVFEMTYTRFLDLQKAEAQAREAQIETALEKVRSRTMAMQHSDELQEASHLLDEQVRALGIRTWGCAFNIYGKHDSTEWFGNEAGVLPTYTVPHVGIFKEYYDRGQKGESLFIKEFRGQECIDHYEYMSSLPVIGEVLKTLKNSNDGFPSYQIDHVVYFKYGYVLFITREHVSEAHDIFKRFAKVFEQTYTRFLDLQKAEDQNEEAKIQLALERVRARIMAMHESDELSDAASEMFQQMANLSVTPERLNICFFKEEERTLEVWPTDESGLATNKLLTASLDEPTTIFKAFTAWKEKKKAIIIDLHGKELEEWVAYVREAMGLTIKEETLNNRRIHSMAFFSHGLLMTTSSHPIPAKSLQLLERFTQVFDQAYIRFLDLQKAEVQAREAQIEVALERVRSKAMSMHSSDDLAQTVDVFFHEIKSLNVSPRRCGVTLINKESTLANVALTSATDNGEDVKLIGQLDLSGHPVFDEVYRHWQIQEEYHPILKGEELRDYYQFMNPQLEYPIFPDDKVQFGHYLYFEEGVVFAWTDQELSNEDLEIFRKFKSVLSLTYRRYLDLREAEAQAKESQIELSLERIRSQVTGMQESSDLLDIVVTMRTEFVNLGHEAHYFWHMRWLPDTYKKAMTSGDGTKIGMVMTLPRHIHGDIAEVAAWEKTKDPIHVLAMDVDVALDYIDKMITLGDFERVDPQAPSLDDIRHIGGLTFVMARTTHGEIGFSLPGVVKDPPEEAMDTLVRFAGVFDLAYRRFEDLKKAEAQMRENRIELSLERIRGQVTAMQESSDLFDIVVGMRKEFISLGHESDYFWHMRWLPEVYEMSMTSEDGNRLGMVIQVPKVVHDQIDALAEWEKSDDPIFVLPLNAKDAWDYLENMNTYGHYEKADPNAPTQQDIEHIGGLTFIIARTTHGEIGYSLPGMVPNPPKEALDTLVRFAGVFDLAYKRFEDLKTAEKDLIEIKRARQKAEDALIELKATQTQLVQQEKLASLGQLTAGIAHEIKNPLNFVNNFSEVSVELIDEAFDELKELEDSEAKEEVIAILNDVRDNLTKVHDHGSRADSIVKSMLQHSRGGSGKMEPTNLNALVKEYVNLAFHGMRANKNPINVKLDFDLDENLGQINLIGEDFSRVVLNLCNNAFDAMREKAKTEEDYKAVLSVSLKREGDAIDLSISDNGPGIPDSIKDKVFQPFFTTKKGTEGTGLGLSITNDIVKAHGGEMNIVSNPGTGTTFSIHLSTSQP